MCHVHPAPAGLILLLSFFFFVYFTHMCIVLSPPPLVPPYGKLKEKLQSFPAIGGWSFATGDRNHVNFFFFFGHFVAIKNQELNRTSSPSRIAKTYIFFTISTCVGWLSPINFTSSTCAREGDTRLIHSRNSRHVGRSDRYTVRCQP